MEKYPGPKDTCAGVGIYGSWVKSVENDWIVHNTVLYVLLNNHVLSETFYIKTAFSDNKRIHGPTQDAWASGPSIPCPCVLQVESWISIKIIWKVNLHQLSVLAS